jgi:hypothetical protein
VVKHVIGNPQSLRSSIRTDYTASEAASEGSEDERSPRGGTGSRQQKPRDTSDGSGSDGSASDDDESTHMGSDISVHDDVASEERSEEMSEPEVYSKPSSRRASNATSDKARGKMEKGGAWPSANNPKPTGVKASKSLEVRRNPAESDEERSPTVQEKGVSSVRKEVVLTADREHVAESEELHVVQLIPSRKVQEAVQTVKIGAAFSDGNRVSESRRALSPLRPGGSKGSNVGGSGGRLRGEGAGFR